MNPNDLETWAELLAPTPRGYMTQPLETVRDPIDDETHVVNGHYQANNQTLCGKDAGEWTGFNYTRPTCFDCEMAALKIDPAYGRDLSYTEYGGGWRELRLNAHDCEVEPLQVVEVLIEHFGKNFQRELLLKRGYYAWDALTGTRFWQWSDGTKIATATSGALGYRRATP